MVALPPYAGGGPDSKAFALNDSAVAAGWSDADANGNNQHATIWNGTTGSDLGTLGGPGSEAYGINNAGQVVGGSDVDSAFTFHAFLYDGAQMNDLGTLGGNFSEAFGINDAGQVVGDSSLPGETVQHAFLYDGTQMNDLGTLGGSTSQAKAINQLGDVVGSSKTSGLQLDHAFLYTSDAGMMDLGALGASSQALALNNLDQVVGLSNNHAFIYDSGTMTDLNTLLPAGSTWTLLAATGINDVGQITGYGMPGNGSTIHAFLMTPDAGPASHGPVGRVPRVGAFTVSSAPSSLGSTDFQSVLQAGRIENPSSDSQPAATEPIVVSQVRCLHEPTGDLGSTSLVGDCLAGDVLRN
jgi:probable HAF family extracellular repeat protein